MSQLVVRSSEEYWLLLSDGNSRTGRPALLYTVMNDWTLLAPDIYIDVWISQNYDGEYK